MNPYNGHPMTMDRILDMQDRRNRVKTQGIGGMGQGLLSSVASSAIRRISVETQITPDFDWDPNAPTDPGTGFGGWFMRTVVKPSVVVQTAAGPMRYAPYGPPANLFPVVALGVTALSIGAIYLMGKGVIWGK